MSFIGIVKYYGKTFHQNFLILRHYIKNTVRIVSGAHKLGVEPIWIHGAHSRQSHL